MRGPIALALFTLIAAAGSAHAGEWCGSRLENDAPMHCGFSSLAECHQVMGDKDAYCVIDPDVARRPPKNHRLARGDAADFTVRDVDRA